MPSDALDADRRIAPPFADLGLSDAQAATLRQLYATPRGGLPAKGSVEEELAEARRRGGIDSISTEGDVRTVTYRDGSTRLTQR